MARSSLCKAVCIFVLSALTTSVVFAQQPRPIEYRRLSLTINGGLSLGDGNKGNYFMSSNFSVNTQETPTAGLAVQYALTPIWSMELGYQHATIKEIDNLFEATINQVELKSIINLNQLFSLNQITSRLNPFISAGAGYDLYNYKGNDHQFRSHNTSYNVGIGLAFNISNTVDLLAQNEYHIGSNAMDNVRAGFGADVINTLTAGIRINFGKKDTRLASWREAPVDLSRSDYERLLTQSALVYELRDRVEQGEQRDREMADKVSTLEQKSAVVDTLMLLINQMNTRIQNLRQTFAQLQVETEPLPVDNETGFASPLPRGYYVQVFAATELQHAQGMRIQTIQSLGEVINHAPDKVFITHRKHFFEVFIGVFSEFSHAQEVRQMISQLQDDAYVITFPRAENWRPDYQDLRIIDETGHEISMSER